MTSAAIIALLADAEASPEHWAELVRRHGTRLWAVCRAVAGADLADDAFQNGLITIRRRASRFRPGPDPESSALGWMVTVVHHCAIDLIRQESRRRTREGQHMPHEPPASATAEADRSAVTAQAMAALEQLPERHRQVIRLRLLGGLDAEQVAMAIGCPPEQVRVRLFRALQLLRSRCTVQLGAMSPIALAQRISQAAAPPHALPTSAQLIATTTFTTPVVTGMSLGAIMAVSSISVSLLAAVTLTVGAVLAPTAAAGVDQPAPSESQVVAATQPMGDSVSVASDIMAIPDVSRVLAHAVGTIARSRGVQGSNDALYGAAEAAIAQDHELLQGLAGILAEGNSHDSLVAMRTFLSTGNGKAYLDVQANMQAASSGPDMQRNLRLLADEANQAAKDPAGSLPTGLPFDERLARPRSLAQAAGAPATIRHQLLETLARQNPGIPALDLDVALDCAFAANPRWQDPMLKVYAAHMDKSDMEAYFTYASSRAGIQQADRLPRSNDETNTLIIKHLDGLIAAIKRQLAGGTAAPAPAGPATKPASTNF